MQDEVHYVPWRSLAANLEYFDRMFMNSREYDIYAVGTYAHWVVFYIECSAMTFRLESLSGIGVFVRAWNRCHLKLM